MGAVVSGAGVARRGGALRKKGPGIVVGFRKTKQRSSSSSTSGSTSGSNSGSSSGSSIV